LGEPTDAQLALGEFYGIGRALIAAAARESCPRPRPSQPNALDMPSGWPINRRRRKTRGWSKYSAPRARRYDLRSGRGLRRPRRSSRGQRLKQGVARGTSRLRRAAAVPPCEASSSTAFMTCSRGGPAVSGAASNSSGSFFEPR
jgi:hypothetical protein